MVCTWVKQAHQNLLAIDLVRDGYACLNNAALKAIAGRRSEKTLDDLYVRCLCNLPARLMLAADRMADSIVEVETLLQIGRDLLGNTSFGYQMRHFQMQDVENRYALLLKKSPPTLMLDVYALLEQRAKQPLDLIDFRWLMLFGLACHGLAEMKLCKFCPRIAVPGNTVCHFHSQEKNSHGTASEKAQRYRLGKQVAEDYNFYVTEHPSFIELNAETLPSYIMRLLWRVTLPDEARTIRAIKQQISLNSRLKELVGDDYADLKGMKFYERLQQQIDPYEVRPKVWRWKLKRFRLWLSFEYYLLNRPRKISRGSWCRLVEASHWEQRGCTKSEIARLMSMSPSTISNWLSRFNTSTLQAAVEKHIENSGCTRGVNKYENKFN